MLGPTIGRPSKNCGEIVAIAGHIRDNPADIGLI
jgi:hypothetical protein